MNSSTIQSVSLSRIQWASLLINLRLLRQTTTIEYLTNEIADQLNLPLPAEEQLVPTSDSFYR